MKKPINILSLFMLIVVSASCGVYQRNSTEADLQQHYKNWYQNQKNLELAETIETITETSGDTLSGVFLIPKKLSKEPLNFHVNSEGAKLNVQLTEDALKYNLTNKKKQSTAVKKTSNSKDKGSVKTHGDLVSDLSLKNKNKQNPWRPPWYVSGLIVVALLVLYKVLKSKFKIVKIQNLNDEKK